MAQEVRWIVRNEKSRAKHLDAETRSFALRIEFAALLAFTVFGIAAGFYALL